MRNVFSFFFLCLILPWIAEGEIIDGKERCDVWIDTKH